MATSGAVFQQPAKITCSLLQGSSILNKNYLNLRIRISNKKTFDSRPSLFLSFFLNKDMYLKIFAPYLTHWI
jgi:hypothetical protein